jgi:hypothetical protein
MGFAALNPSYTTARKAWMPAFAGMSEELPRKSKLAA